MELRESQMIIDICLEILENAARSFCLDVFTNNIVKEDSSPNITSVFSESCQLRKWGLNLFQQKQLNILYIDLF